MELKTSAYVTIEITSHERQYTFSMPVGAPYGEAYDAAFSVVSKVLELAQDSAQKNREATMSQQSNEVPPENRA